MAIRGVRANGDEPFDAFCRRFGFDVPNVAEIPEMIKDVEAFRFALSLLNPSLDRSISKKFMLAVIGHALLLDRNSGDTNLAKPALSRISKKELLLRANRVSKLCEELETAVDALLELCIPASLALPPTKDGRTDALRSELLVTLPQKTEDIIAVRNIALKCRVKFATVGTKRDINPIDPPQKAFAKKLARIWKEADRIVTTRIEGEFDQFLCWTYQAVTGKEHSSSATSRSQALETAREIDVTPEAPAYREKLADQTRHTMTFNKWYRNRPQVAPVKLVKEDEDSS